VDNLTHTLSGLMLARAGFDRFTPRAAAILMVAANIPDCDTLSALSGWLNYLQYHRWITHSLLFVPATALAAVLLVAAFGWRRVRWGPAYAIAIVGVLSHLLLDWTNSYGVRLLAPVSEHWFRLDITNVVDLWILAALFLGLAGPLLARLVSAEIGAHRSSGRALAMCVLVLIAAYDFGRYLAHQRAVQVMDSRVYDGAAPLRVTAIPGAADPFVWRGVVETSSFVSILPVDLLGDFDPAAGQIFYKPEPGAAIAAARRTEVFRKFLAFSQLPFWAVAPAVGGDGSVRVEVTDLRFGFPGRGFFAISALVNAAGQVEQAGGGLRGFTRGKD